MTTLRTPPAGSGPLTPSATPPVTTPPATRAQAPGWRDPRLALGVVLVAGCVLLGSRIVAGADDTVAVWGLSHDVPAGAPLTAGDLEPVRVHLDGPAADRYLAAASAPAAGATAAHDLSAGELLPRSAVVTDAGGSMVEVPLSVAPDDLPAGLGRGASVDVWVLPDAPATGGERVRARLVLDDVVVVAVPSAGDSLAPRSSQQVIVGVSADRAGTLADALGQLAAGRVVLTRQAGA